MERLSSYPLAQPCDPGAGEVGGGTVTGEETEDVLGQLLVILDWAFSASFEVAWSQRLDGKLSMTFSLEVTKP